MEINFYSLAYTHTQKNGIQQQQQQLPHIETNHNTDNRLRIGNRKKKKFHVFFRFDFSIYTHK